MPRPPRIEWISLLYLVFFVFAILSPQLVSRDLFGIAEEHVEEALIFCFGLAGLVTFTVYEHIVERGERERAAAVLDRDRIQKELASSYEYIGTMNRRFEALKSLANETAFHLVEADRLTKEAFRSLLAGAATSVRAEQGVVRIISLEQMRTLKEYAFGPQGGIHVPNKALRAVHDAGKSHIFITSDEGVDVLVVPAAHRELSAKAFLLFPRSQEADGVDIGLLSVYANHADALYRMLAQREERQEG